MHSSCNGASGERTSNVEFEKLVTSIHKDREESTDKSTDWCSVISEAKIKQAQGDDPMLAPLIESMRAGERPPSSEIQGNSRSTHVMWSNWSRLVIENDILYRRSDQKMVIE